MTFSRSLLSFFGCQGLSFSLGWIQKDVELKITKQCTLRFAITEKYIDEVTCEVVPLDVCQVIFCSPYLWDRDAIHYRRLQKYRFFKDGMEFMINAAKTQETVSLITAAQAKRLVNACGKLILLMIRPKEQNQEIIKSPTHSLKPNQKASIDRLLKQRFEALFQDIKVGGKPRRSVEQS